MNRSPSNELRDKLRYLYRKQSKHSSYQSIPRFISESIGYQETISQNWRGDANRYEFILSKIPPLTSERWCDFGANTGFFTFSLAEAFPKSSFLAVEANPDHSDFLNELRQAFEITNVEILGGSIGIDELNGLKPIDVMLHLNVLHHVGADFDKSYVTDRASFMTYATQYLKQLKRVSAVLVLQVGLNLWGDKRLPIFPIEDSLATAKALKSLIDLSGWIVQDWAYPVIQASGAVCYESLPGDLLGELAKKDPNCDWEKVGPALAKLGLFEHVGEFYHRPLLVLRQ